MHPAAGAGVALPWSWRLAASAATVTALAVLCLVLAHWFWRIAAPAPTLPPPAAVPESAAALLAAAAPFGRAAPAASVAAGPATAATAPQTDVRLLGVLAAAGGKGQALLRLPDRGPVLVNAGAEVATGVELVAVFPDRISVRDGGQTRDILLRAAPGAALVTRAAPASAARPGADRGACAAPPDFKGSVYRINAELLGGLAAQPDTWKPLLTASSAGLRISEGGGFAAMLGLKPGDSLREANGIRLTAAADLIVAVVKPLQGNQAVRVKAVRDGSDLELLLVNASACASGGGAAEAARVSPAPAASRAAQKADR